MSLAAVRVQTELGTERLCRRCGDVWPEDDEFWYFQTRPLKNGALSRRVVGYCKACWHEHRYGKVVWSR